MKMGYLFWGWYTIGLILMLTYDVPDLLHFSNGLFLVFFAMYALTLERQELRSKNLQRHASLSIWARAGIVAVSTYILEWFGTETGYPFGTYEYTDTLSIFGEAVPIAIGFAWIGVMVMSVLMSTGKTLLTRALQTGFWAMLLDLVLDPAAFANEFWLWSGTGFYAGIPLQNFISWFGAAFLLSFLFPLYHEGRDSRPSRSTVFLYQGMLAMFGLLSLKEGLVVPALISVLGIAAAEGVHRYASSPKKQMV
ncbi:carotenoid biosynthesis protein [Paenibacillus sp. JSM ZJ436]|uniref:carotenoid biosynthesis protein n=1 Tax=Paenibacillus sp. JSM ZJ436 TaxID=3376190 RepID=UPI00379DD146